MDNAFIKHILVVDDEEGLRVIIREILIKMGYVCEDASNTLEALQRLHDRRFDLVLSDIRMEGKDGIELMQEARRLYPHLDFIIMTGHQSGYSYSDIIAAGAADFIGKPFDTRKLKSKLERIEREKRTLFQLHQSNERLQKANEELQRANEALKREVELKSYMAKLEQSNQALQDFTSIASHDMQEPLRKIKAFGDTLNQKYGDLLGQEGKDYLDRMINATNRMELLLDSLLDYSRVTTKTEPFMEVELPTIIREVLSDLEVRIEKTGGQVLVGDLPAIEADPTQMRQLFQNLIGNALKYHKEGERPVIKVRSTTDDQTYRIVVEDNGIGFDEKHLDRVFAPFQRLHDRNRYEGTGMGLAICKKIVERHGGNISARSMPGQGATFIVSLPLGQAESASQSRRV